ncbi:MAG: Spy/CpxP family protein refolding chaperone [Candidatus Gastranaerophilales bacterium]|nr:Spy/CpxP family protein refolding chaperone [Candidatus Gastranaerophilales bacterium]
MKKQILTLTMCLALTSTVALAQAAVPVTKVKPATTAAKPVTPAAKSATTFVSKLTPQEEARRRFEERRAQERALMYNSLKLTEDQKTKAEALDAKTRAEAGKYIDKVRTETRKLRDLKTKKASFVAVWKQKLVLNEARKEADNYFITARKSFEAILTKEQLAQFKLNEEARRKEMAKFRKNHKHPRHRMGSRGHAPKRMGTPPAGMGPKYLTPPTPAPEPATKK